MALTAMPMATDDGARTNVRAPASVFLGRTAELERLAELFQDARLVTVFGPGGIGKTRLAIRYAEDRIESYSAQGQGGVRFIDLSEARSSGDVLVSVAGVLGIELSGRTSDDDMANAIGRGLTRFGRTLLVIDNVEQVAADAARWFE